MLAYSWIEMNKKNTDTSDSTQFNYEQIKNFHRAREAHKKIWNIVSRKLFFCRKLLQTGH